MINIHFLGTCSGTEPQPGRRHTSLVIEYKNKLYWFDAGESCGYTAHVLGLDLLTTEAIFLSHPHMDHVGGLPHLVWTIKKLESRSKNPLEHQAKVLVPHGNIWSGLKLMLFSKTKSLDEGFSFVDQRITDGTIYQQDDISVEALHNNHIPEPDEQGNRLSFSFLIKIAGRRILYSGDFRNIKEIDPLIDGTDLLLLETGHHQVSDLCQYLVNHNKDFKELGFYHHGRAILANPRKELEKARAILGDKVFLADDGMVKQIDPSL